MATTVEQEKTRWMGAFTADLPSEAIHRMATEYVQQREEAERLREQNAALIQERQEWRLVRKELPNDGEVVLASGYSFDDGARWLHQCLKHLGNGEFKDGWGNEAKPTYWFRIPGRPL